MDGTKLESALAVAEYLNFSEAAFHLSLSPSAVSKQVAALETELGVRLFQRSSGRQVTLTREGQRLLPFLQEAVRGQRTLMEECRKIRDSETCLVVGVPPIYPVEIVSELIVEFLKLMPKAIVTEVRQENGVLLDMLYHGKIDVGIASLLGTLEDNPEFSHLSGDENLVTIPLMYQQEHILVNRRNPLAGRQEAELEDLCEQKDVVFLFICRELNTISVRQKVFMRECEKNGYTPTVKTLYMDRSTAMSVLLQYVASDPRYVAFTPSAHTGSDIVSLRHKRNFFNPIPFVYYLKSERSAAVRNFGRVAHEVSRRYIPLPGAEKLPIRFSK